MSEKPFSIYRSSAGSGKTRTLAKGYLTLALRFRSDYYKHILAVTFTNKATQEMKDRILRYLDAFSRGQTDSLASELMQELNLNPAEFKERCNDLRTNILHNYSQFSISTIDAFFQQVIRSFTREAGLAGDYRLEVENEEVMAEVVDKLVDELGENKQLTEWVIEFAKANLENERAWDVRSSVVEFSNEIFREEFRAIENELIQKTSEPGYFKKMQQQLQQEASVFMATIRGQARAILGSIRMQGWDAGDFKYGGGVYGLLEKMSEAVMVKDVDEKAIGARARKDYLQATNWPNDKSINKKNIYQKAEHEYIPAFISLITYRDKHYARALSAEMVLNTFYAFGLTADLARKLREYKEEHNMMLLADAPKFLNGIIRESDTPFIYEKVGSFYRNYLIDEFQDTSGLQWENFKPLLLDSLDQGYPGMVVGDVKQSIYRWRGGDLQLLQQHVEDHVGTHRVEVRQLANNFRSARNIVEFNNAFFQHASKLVSDETHGALAVESYADVAQQHSKSDSGYVKIQFVEGDGKEILWKDEVLDRLPLELERLQDKGVPLNNIAILVRNNAEGAAIASYLLRHRTENNDTGYRYDVISNESLRVDGAVTVNILVSALKYLINPEDIVARAQLCYDYGRLKTPAVPTHELFAVSRHEDFRKHMPDTFVKSVKALQKLPLFEITETLIEIFGLGSEHGEMPYLQTFQNLVLEFYTRERNDIAAFLEWWEENREKKSIQVSGQVDAIQILTIHKSKGLQFPYVIIPFCSWETDHSGFRAPLLWIKANEAPFREETIVPVRYNKRMPDSVFGDAYAQEKLRVWLDNLNLLYVAFTRAESGLVVFAPSPRKQKQGNTVAGLMYDTITSSLTLGANWNDHTDCWSVGEIQTPTAKSIPEEALSLTTYASSSWRNKMVLRKKQDNIFDTQTTPDQTQREHGLLVHALLSRVQYADEVDEVLAQAVATGLVTSMEANAVADQLRSLLTRDHVAQWFTRDWDVKTEIPILSPTQPDVRVDRLMIRDKKAVVIDYKTGEPRASDEEQVASYMSILREMNFTEVEGFVLYLATGEVVSAGSRTRTRKKEKNESQLNLGF